MKSYYGGPIGSHTRSFERYHPWLPMSFPTTRLGVRNPNPKLQWLLSQERVKLQSKFGWYIYRVHPNKSPLQIWERRECGRIQGLPKFFEYPLLFQEWVKLRIQILYRHSDDQLEQKSIKNFSKSSRGRTQVLSKIFRAPIYRAHRVVIFAVAQLSVF